MSRLLLLLAALALVACSSPSVDTIPPPPSLPPSTTSTTSPDFSRVAIEPVPGRTTTTLALGGGIATLQGTVIGPEGPVAGAIVRIERLVDDSVAVADVHTQPDGTWTVAGILGGRFRVRAWRAPDLAQVEPEIFFLDGAETKALNLPVNRYGGLAAVADIAPEPPVVDDQANLVIQVTNRGVDDQGVVRGLPAGGVQVELFGSAEWRVAGENPTQADGNGVASFRVRCASAGRHPLSVVLNNQEAVPIDVPQCVERPVEETTTTTAGGVSTTSSTTSTTTRGAPTTLRP